jgi:hypothetical protein
MKRLAALLGALMAAGAAHAGEPARLPDGLIAQGSNDVAEAWLTLPTQRYAHGILGDAIEAGGMAVRTTGSVVLEFVLPDEFVFEDRQVRVHDLDGDGQDEIVVVLSSRTEGGALAIYGVRDGRIVKLAQTPHIGRSNRWLNPAEIADLDGDGRLDIVYVDRPHLAKIVHVWHYVSGELKPVTTLEGYSNHVIGSPEQDLTEVVTLSDGSRALAIPTLTYDELAFLILKKGELTEVARVPAAGRITTLVSLNKNGRQLEFTTGQTRRSVEIP